MPQTGSCFLAFRTALPLLVRMFSASPGSPAAGQAVVVAAASLALSALSNGCAFEGEGGNRPGAGRTDAHPARCHCMEEKSCGTAQWQWGRLSLAGMSACASGNNGANGSWSPASKWLCADGLAETVFLTQLGINGPFLPLHTSSTSSLHFLPL